MYDKPNEDDDDDDDDRRLSIAKQRTNFLNQ